MSSSFTENATIVLVHGPWLDAGMWNRVILPLRQQGLRVVAAQLPLTSFEDDLAAIERTIEQTDGPAITPAWDETVGDLLIQDNYPENRLK